MSTTDVEVEMANAPTPVETTVETTEETTPSDEKGVDVDAPASTESKSDAGSDAGSDKEVIEVSEDVTDVATTPKGKILFLLQFYSIFFVKI